MTDGFDDQAPSADDAALLARLDAALGLDPLPEGLLARAEGLLAFRDVDRELLELLQDAAPEPAGLRGAVGSPARLSFELGGGAVSVELVFERDELRGHVLAGTVTEVSLQRLTEPARTAAVDEFGQFSFDDPTPGPARLRLRGSAARAMTTDWFLL